ncbi:MAG: trigger factor [Deltaproteobacteria bacterium]|nr:trigger factor [Deltaproteobacteria bacterium]
MRNTDNDFRIELEDLSQVKKKLNITIGASRVKMELDDAYHSLRATAAIAGFRKGNVPISVLKSKFSAGVEEDVAKNLVESSYPRAVKEKELLPVEAPKVEMISKGLREGEDFAFSVTVEVSPKVEITGYRGMEIRQETIEVTDKDMEDGLARLRDGRAEYREVERQAASGDMVVIDFEGFIEGQPIKNGKGSDYPTVIGEKTLLPGFDEAILGAAKGDVREANVTFPANYSEPGLAGNGALFKITVKAVKEKSVPRLDDEFAKGLGCDDLDGLKSKVKDELARVKQISVKEALKTEILDKLTEKYDFEVPDALVNRYLGVILGRVVENMKHGNTDPADTSLSPEELKAKYRTMAVRSVKEDIILDAISARENIQITEEDTEKAVRHLAESRKVPYESLLARIEREGAMEVIKDGLKHEKVFDLILGSSNAAVA